MKEHAALRLIVGVSLVGLAGCRHAPTGEAGTGTSSFAFVERPVAPPPARTVTTEPVDQKPIEEYREARPVYPLVNPVYPPPALKARAGRATVGVRITVDVTGQVTDVAPSMLVFSSPGPFADEFRAAVETAVRQWRFRPAEVEKIEFVQTPTVSYSRIVGRQKVETHLDVAFNFTASGGVELTR
ncbi:MAG TPA: TonB family protein [Lacunisphaera sp.]